MVLGRVTCGVRHSPWLLTTHCTVVDFQFLASGVCKHPDPATVLRNVYEWRFST